MAATQRNMASQAGAFKRVLEVLDRHEIPYAVVGSVASSIYGIPRTTRDVDLIVDLSPDRIAEFASELQAEFYADPDAMKEAIQHGRSFNLIHLTSSFRIDIFPLQHDEYSRVAFTRRRFAATKSLGGEPVECALASPEDTILGKLRSYRAGGETSDVQWNDLRDIRMTSGDILDLEYLRHWAQRLGVSDLLERLLTE